MLDLDSYKPGHDADLACLPDLPATRVHRTQSGGTHLIFLDPEGRCSSGKIGPNGTIDVRAGTSKDYVCLPAPGTGYEVAEDRPPAVAPEALLEAMGGSRVTVQGDPDRPLPAAEPLPVGFVPRMPDKEDSEWTWWLAKRAIEDGLEPGQLLTLLEGDETTIRRIAAIRRQQPNWWPDEFWRLWDKNQKRAKPMTADDLNFCSDLGNSAWFINDHEQVVRYAQGIGWLVWDGRLWRPDEGMAMELAKQTVRDMWTRAWVSDNREKLSKHAARSQEASRLAAMLRLAQSVPGVRIEAADLDTQPYLLTCGNGTVDLRTGELLPSSPEHLMTKGSDIDYFPDAACPMWDEWMKWFTDGDQELADWYQTSAGFTLIGSTGAQYFVLLWGPGANGKTTFVLALAGLLGELAHSGDADMLSVARKQGGHSDALAALAGKRMVYLPETNNRGQWDEALIKSLTGGEPLSASFKGKSTFQFMPQMMLWAYGNAKPDFQDNSDGMWRRIRLVEQTKRVPGARIPDYHRVLLAKEGPGIMAWAVRGAMRAAKWLEDGGELDVPPRVRKTTERYRSDQDVVGQFVKAVLASEDGWVSGQNLWSRYTAWQAQVGGKFANSQADLVRQVINWLTARGHEAERVKRRGYYGIRGVSFK